MKKELLSIVTFFLSTFFTSSISFPLYGEAGVVKNLADSGKTAYSGFASAPFKKVGSGNKYSSAIFGNALNFDGIDDYVTMGAGLTLPQTGWTEEMWIFVPSLPPAVQFMDLISGDDMAVSSKRGPFLMILGNNSLHGGYGYGTENTQRSYEARNVLTVNAWNHIAQTYNGSRLKTYVNGIQVIDVAAPERPNANPIKYLGRGLDNDYNYYFKEAMDEVRIWNRARTAEEIRDNYANTVPSNHPDLLLYYSFNQGTEGGDNRRISAVTDNTGKNNGSVNNFALTGIVSNYIFSLILLDAPRVNPTADITENSFTVRWQAPSGIRVTNYILEIATSADFTKKVPGYETVTVPATQTSFRVSGLSPDVTYYYRVRVAPSGPFFGAASNIISVKTAAITGFGNALSFDGVDDYVTMGAGLTLPQTGWTEEMWIFVPGLPPAVQFMDLISGDDMAVSSKRGPFLMIFGNNSLHGGYGYGTENTQRSYEARNVLTVNAWNHIAQTYNGSRLKAYVNGVQVADVEASELPNANPIKYLGRGLAGYYYDFKGSMDEVRIWNRARTAEEIRDNYTKTVSPNDADLLAYYDFNQGIAGGDNLAIEALIDNKGSYAIFNNFAKTGAESNFVGTLKLVPPTATPASEVTFSSFTARWAGGEGSSPAANTYFIDVSTDETFADESKYVTGYRNKEVGNVAELTVTGLNPSTAYYYRVRAGYLAPWLHPSDNSNAITVNTGVLPAITAVDATNIAESSFTAGWQAAPVSTIDNYILEIAASADFTKKVLRYETITVPATQTTFTVSGLSPDVTYYYRVKAVSGEFVGTAGNIIPVKTAALSGFGNALSFDGERQGNGNYVTMRAGLTLPQTGWTEEMWVYVPVLPSNTHINLISGDDMHIFSKRGPFFQIYNDADNIAILQGGYGYGTGDNQRTYEARNVLTVNAWNHIAQTYNGSRLRAYVNGIQVADVEAMERPNANPIKYLGRGLAGFYYDFIGSMDEVRIWNYARSADEIRDNYTKTVSPSSTGLIAYYDFNQGIAGGDNRAIEALIDNKGSYAIFNNFAKTGVESNFMGTLKLVPPAAAPASEVTFSSFTARWVGGEGSSPTANTYFIDVSTDETFADESKYVTGYRNKEVGNVAELTVTGLNPSTAYYYRVRAGYSAPWLHPSDNSNTITVNTGVLPAITAVDATNIAEGSFTAGWQAASVSTIDNYILEIATSADFIKKVLRYETITVPATQTTFTVSGLSPGITYYYRVKAVSGEFVGTAGNIIPVTTTALSGFGNALSFDGENDYLTMGAGLTLPQTGWTEEMWVYVPVLPSNTHINLISGDDMHIFSKRGPFFQIYNDADNIAILQGGYGYGTGDNQRTYEARNVLTVNAWNHIAQTYDGSRLKAYVNGIQVADVAATKRPNANPIKYLGRGFAGYHHFKGAMDEVRIWNRARTVEEIRDNYTKTVSPNDADLLAYYDFNQGIAGGDNRAIEALIDNKGSYAILNNFAKTGAESNFVGTLKLVPPTATPASEVTFSSFTARWVGGEGSSPTANTYFIDVSTDETFADESKYVTGYRNKEVGNVAELTVTGLNPSTAYYYRVRAGYSAPWLHPGDNSNTITVNTGVLPAITAVEATNITEGSFMAGWKAPSSGRVTNYILEIATSADFTKKAPGQAYITVPATQTSFMVSGLSPDVTYYYRVKAVSGGATGTAGNIISVKTAAITGFGNALSFDGDRDYVAMGEELTLPQTGWTEEMWIYVPTLSAAALKEEMMIIGGGDEMSIYSKRAPFLMIYDNTSLWGGYGYGTGNNLTYTARNVLTVNAWNHIAQTYNGSRLKAYVNGVQVADVAATKLPNANPIKYLGRGHGEYFYDFKGMMDEVRIWSRARTAEEIRDNYANTVPSNHPDLLLYYSFNQGTAGGDNRSISAVTDNTGRNNGVFHGFALNGPSSNYVSSLVLLDAPVVEAASSVTEDSFTVRWRAPSGRITNYILEIATSADFTKKASGHHAYITVPATQTTFTVSGLSPDVTYYCRVRAATAGIVGIASNIIPVKTAGLSGFGNALNFDGADDFVALETGLTLPHTGWTEEMWIYLPTVSWEVEKMGMTVIGGDEMNIFSKRAPFLMIYGNTSLHGGYGYGTGGNQKGYFVEKVLTVNAWNHIAQTYNGSRLKAYVNGVQVADVAAPELPNANLVKYLGRGLSGYYYDFKGSMDEVRIWNYARSAEEIRDNYTKTVSPSSTSLIAYYDFNQGIAGGDNRAIEALIDNKGSYAILNNFAKTGATSNFVGTLKLVPPTATPASEVTFSSFTARWVGGEGSSPTANTYFIDVSTDETFADESKYVTGYRNKEMGNVAELTLTGLNPSTAYYYRVRAGYLAPWLHPSDNSNAITVNTDVLPAITAVDATNITEGSFTAGWQAASVSTIDNYILEIATSADFTKKASGHHAYITVPATQTSFTVSGLSPDVTYYCRVRAAVAGIVGIASNIIPVKTAGLSGFGNALNFDGADDFVALETGLTLPHTGWTEEMWVYVPTVSADVSEGGMIVISNDEMNIFSKRAPFLMIYDDTSLWGGYGYGTGNTQKTYDALNVLTVNAWNHIAQTYDGSRLKAYVNGVQVADVEAMERPNANPIKYLGRAVVEYHYYFKGAMDEVRIWNYARSAEEIRDNYKTTVSPSSTGLIAYYDFNQGIAGEDNRAIKTLIDNKGSYAILNNFAKTGAESNFVGTLKLVPPTATPASEVTFSSFTARWVGGEGSSPTANTYFIDVSTDETFADESKYVTGYRNKEVGNVAELTLTGLNPSTAYYYRVRAGYLAPWLHPSDNSNAITVNTDVLPAITAVDATNITEGSFTAGWQAASVSTIDNYILEIATSADFTKKVPGYETITVPATQTSFTVSGLSPDVTYYYRVKAVSGEATGTAGNIIPVTTTALSSFGNALSFDGEGEGEIERDGDGNYVTMGAGLTLPQTGWTEEMWIYVPTVSDYVNYMGLIGGDELTLWSKRGPFLMIKNNTTLNGGYGYGTGDTEMTYEAPNVLTINAWNHIAQTYDGSRLKAYVNGIQVVDVEALELPNANPIKYLGRGLAGYYYDFKGAMDEVRIWSRARTAEEIGDNYAKTVPSNHPDLLLYYSFNQGTAGGDNSSISAVTDNTGKNHGSFSAFALSGASSNFISSLVLLDGPRANPAADITEGSFTASWEKLLDPRITGYVLEVARDAKFTNLVLGYDGRSFPASVSQLEVKGLSPAFKYYYRVKTVTEGVGIAGNIIPVKTAALSGFGNALRFDGERQGDGNYATMGEGLTLPQTGWTEEMWIYVPTLSADVNEEEMMVISNDEMNIFSKCGPFLMIYDNTSLYGGYGYGTGNTQRTFEVPNVLTVNAWNHIAQTYNGNRLKAYVNGVQVADVEAMERPNANPIKYLGRGVTEYCYDFIGSMDEVRIWNYARSEDEIRDNYTKTVSPSSTGLIAYYDFNQGIAGEDNRAIKALIDNKGSYAILNNFAKTGAESNFVGTLKLIPPTATPVSEVTFSSFTARWVGGEGSSPTANTYFMDVSTDETFADESKYVTGYRNKEVGNVAELTLTGLNPSTAYYYRVRAGYSAPWLHPSDNSNAITVNTGVLPAITAVDATNIAEGSFTAGWQAASVSTIDNYILEIATSADFTKKAPGQAYITVPATQTTFTVSGLSPDVTYYYRVKAVSGEFVGTAGNIIPVKTAAITGFGNALNFDGENDYLTMGAGLTLPQTGWTEEMWIYVPVLPSNTHINLISGDDMHIFSKRGPFVQIYNDADNIAILQGGYGYGTGDNQRTYEARNVLTVNAWNHVAQTYNGSRLKAYVNGVQVADVEASELPNANPIKYLGRGLAGYYYDFIGSMDEVRIWNRARTAEEIRDNYTKTVSPNDADLLAYYDFNQGIAGGDNLAIEALIDNKGSYAIFNNFAKTGAESNFVGTLKLVPPAAAPASEVTFSSFTARWVGGEGSSPTANTYFIDVSTDEIFADESKYVTGYRNKEVGNVAELTVTGLNPSTAYYYRVRAGYSAPWLHPSDNSNTITVNTGVLPAITAVDATNITEGSFTAGWQTALVSTIDNYILEIATSADFTKKVLRYETITVPATQTTFTVSGLSPDVTYYYRVKAVSGEFVGTAGNIIPVKTAAITGFGNALSFDGERQGDGNYVTMRAGLTLPQTGWTEEMWVYVPVLPSNTYINLISGDDMHIFSKRGPFFQIYNDADNIAILQGGYGYGPEENQKTYKARNVLTVNVWNHVAQTYNGSRLKAYVNGVQVADVEASELPNANPIKYLGRGLAGYYYDFKGSMDEVRIWNRARTAEEIRDNYTKTVSPNDADLLAYYDFNQGIAGGDNLAIEALIDNKGSYAIFNNFAKTGAESNFVGTLKLVPPVAAPASEVTFSSFTARWVGGEGSSPTANTYFIDVSTDEIFADESKYVTGYRNKELGNVAELTLTGLNPSTAYYYRVRAGYSAPWLHPSDNSNTITVNTGVLPAITAVDATNITEGSFTAGWQTALVSTIDNYILEIATSADFTKKVLRYETITVPATQTTFTVSGLSPDVTYYYRVKAVLGGATGTAGNIIPVKTAALSGFGNALSFDGERQGDGNYVTMRAGLTLPQTGWTEEMWVYVPVLPSNTYINLISGDDMHIFSKRGPFFQIYNDADNIAILQGGYGYGPEENQKTYKARNVLTVNVWNHVAQTYNGSRLKAYVNGVQVADVEASELPNANPIKYLGRGLAGYYYDFKGSMDEVRIWNRARTAEEIRDNYTKTVSPNDADLLAYYDFNQGIAGGDNLAIEALIDNKGSYAIFNNFAKTGAESNFVGTLKLVPPVAAPASEVTFSSFTARWVGGEGSSPTANTYFIDVSTDEIFADESKYVTGYRNKELGNVAELTLTGLNPSTAYYYRVRAGYSAPWLHPSDNSNTITVNTGVLPAITAVDATNITEGSFTAGWQTALVSTIDNYILEIATSADFTKKVLRYETITVPATQTTFTVSGLSPEVTYYYRVKAVLGGATGTAGNIIPVKTAALSGFGNALSFDGERQGDGNYVTMRAGLTLPQTGWTEEMWVYVPVLPSNTYINLISGDDMHIFSKRGPFFQIYNDADNIAILQGGYGYGTGDNQRTYEARNVLTVNAWNHIAQTYNGSRLKAYVNGIQVADVEASELPNANPIKYLGRGLSGFYYDFIGSMDEVRIWNRARTAEEIRDNYTKTVSPKDADLLAYYDFNQGIAGGDNRAIEALIDNKGVSRATLNKFTKTGVESNFMGTLKLVPPVAAPASEVTFSSFTARWVGGESSSPTANTYFIDVSTDETFADESKYVTGYRNKELGNVAKITVTGLNPSTAYYYRVRAGYSAPWLHPSDNSNTITVNTGVLPAITAVDATNIAESSFTAGWQAAPVSTIDNYILEIAASADFTKKVLRYETITVPATQTTFTVSGLSPDVTYYYRVKAVSGEFVGTAGNIIPVKTAAITGFGNALSFDGENDYLTMGAGLTLPQTGWTEEMWVYVPVLPSNTHINLISGDDMHIFSKRGPFVQIYNDADNIAILQGGYGYGTGDNQRTYEARNVLTVNAWNHIAQTYNGSRLKAYVNGIQVADVEAMERPNANPIKYLGRGLAGYYYDFKGAMDEVRIWSRARTAEEIRDNYTKTVSPNDADLLAYYDFNQGIAGGDNRAIEALIDNKGSYAILNNFAKTGAESNFVGTLKLVPPTATPASEVTFSSFTARWVGGEGSSPTANTYFIDVSTDETFADESKYVTGYRNKEVGNVAELTVTGLNPSTAYYYRVRAGYSAPWLHPSDNSNTIKVNTGVLPAITAVDATNITEGSFTAGWQAAPVSTIDNYILEIAASADFTKKVPGYETITVPATQTTFTVSGLSPGITYYYRVKAVLGGATGTAGNIIPVKTAALSGFGNALNFDGENDYLTMGAGLTLPQTGWTEEMWVYVPVLPSNTHINLISGDDMRIFSKRGPFFQIYNDADNIAILQGGYGYGTRDNQRTYEARNVLTVNAWNHIAQTYNGSRLKAYVNGVQVADVEASELPNANPINYLGRGLAGYYYDFKGAMDEVRIWNRARTAEEIRDNYTKTVSPKDADLIAYYDFNQGIAGGDNRAIEALIDNKGSYAILNNFAKTETRSNFVGELKLSPPVASSAIDITEDSFTARWAMGEGSTPTANTYFIDVSTDETFADESKYVAGYRNKELGDVTSHTVKGLNMPSEGYYYRLRAGYGGSWLHSSVSSGVVSVSSSLQSNTILLASMDEKVYGSSPYQLSVSSSGTGSYAYTLISGDAVSISSTGLVSVLKAGTATISVTQSSDGVYASGGPVIQVITVHPKQLTIAVHAIDKEYDGSTKAFVNLSVIGRIDHDDVTASAEETVFDNKNVGTDKPVYIKSVVLSGSESANYALSAIPSVSASITPRTLIVQAENKTRSPGEDNPLLTVVYKGFIEGDNENNALLSPPLITTKADKSSPSGDYPIEANGAVSLHDNYQIIYHSGVLTVTPVSVTSFTFKASLLYSDSPVGSFAGSFSAESALPSTYAYTLVSGAVDNDKFVLEGENLYVNSKFNYKSDLVFTVRVLVSTQWGFSVIKDFPVNVLHKNKAPTLDRIPDQSVCATSASHSINLSGLSSGGETEQSLSLSISSDRVEMFHTLNVSFLSDGQGVINYSLNSGVSGSAFVTVTVTDNGGTANGGVDAYAVSFRVTSNPLPSIIISSNTDKFKVIRGGSLELTASSPGANSYLWAETKGVLGNRNGSRLLVQPLENTVYMVEVTTEGGCVEFKQIVVEVEDESMDEVVVNNILTPNGDGVNDLWVVQHIERYPNAVVKVFDRGRRLVFIQKGYDNKWDGSFKGRPLRGGTYYYAIDFEGAKKETKKGYLSIIY